MRSLDLGPRGFLDLRRPRDLNYGPAAFSVNANVPEHRRRESAAPNRRAPWLAADRSGDAERRSTVRRRANCGSAGIPRPRATPQGPLIHLQPQRLNRIPVGRPHPRVVWPLPRPQPAANARPTRIASARPMCRPAYSTSRGAVYPAFAITWYLIGFPFSSVTFSGSFVAGFTNSTFSFRNFPSRAWFVGL